MDAEAVAAIGIGPRRALRRNMVTRRAMGADIHVHSSICASRSYGLLPTEAADIGHRVMEARVACRTMEARAACPAMEVRVACQAMEVVEDVLRAEVEAVTSVAEVAVDTSGVEVDTPAEVVVDTPVVVGAATVEDIAKAHEL